MSITAATLTLFHAVLVDESILSQPIAALDEHIVAATVAQGYVVDPRIAVDNALIATINAVVGLSGEQMNQAFHKSWQVIVDTPLEKLIAQQITHYFTTYGLENLGLYNKDLVYIPKEVLQVAARQAPVNQPPVHQPSGEFMASDLPLIVIHAISRDDLLAKVQDMASGIALADATLAHLITIITTLHPNADKAFIARIDNRELKIRLQQHYQLLPDTPLEYLRFVIYQLTGDSLLIKNDTLIKKIKEADAALLESLILQAPANLASIFLRYKPLFLAMKTLSSNKHFFNRLRKDADSQHKPLPADYLNNVTHYIQQESLDLDVFAKKIAKASVYRKIRLANALNYRLNLAAQANTQPVKQVSPSSPSRFSIVYRVRNGRGWATSFNWHDQFNELTQQVFDLTVASIVDDIRPNVAGKTFYIPKAIHYTLPASEKQFTGELPTGSWIAVPSDLIVGIHWTNLPDYRVDLDLALTSIDGEKTGWDARYYDDNQDIVFSGDMTDAPLPMGAAELFYIKNTVTSSQVMTVNNYTHSPEHPVECSLYVASEAVKKSKPAKNYMVNPNNILMQTKLTIDSPQNMLCLITNVDNENRIYVANINIGTSITSSYDDHTQHAQNYLIHTTTQMLQLEDILRQAGATVINSLPNESLATDSVRSNDDSSGLATQNESKKPSLLSRLQARLTAKTANANHAASSKAASLPKESITQGLAQADTTNLDPAGGFEAQTDIINLAPQHISKHTFIGLLTVDDTAAS